MSTVSSFYFLDFEPDCPLRWQSGCLESCVGIVISPTCIHQNESVPGLERFRFGLLSRTFVKAPNAALKRCPYLHHRHNHEHSPYHSSEHSHSIET